VTRVDYFSDPAAPAANSIVVAVTVFALDADQRVLLIRRTDSDLWALPGGAQEIGESIAETAMRETREETGIDIEVTGIVGVYSNPRHVVAFSDGEVRQQFSICFRASPVGGQPTTSDESREVRWVGPDDLGALSIHPSMHLRIHHGYDDSAAPYIG
jgi:ADP-ribose pyrophosphatase YjhB (NUDIX family)